MGKLSVATFVIVIALSNVTPVRADSIIRGNYISSNGSSIDRATRSDEEPAAVDMDPAIAEARAAIEKGDYDRAKSLLRDAEAREARSFEAAKAAAVEADVRAKEAHERAAKLDRILDQIQVFLPSSERLTGK